MDDRKIRLSKREHAVLKAVSQSQGAATGPHLASLTGTSPQGTHQTAASLVRKGLLERLGTSRLQWYGVTALGAEFLRRNPPVRGTR